MAVETAESIDRPDCWERLAQQALKQGNHKVIHLFTMYISPTDDFSQIVEKAYQKTKNFDKLSFLYLATGSTDKLSKMQKIADARGNPMSRFHNALYGGDVMSRISVLRDVGMCRYQIVQLASTLLNPVDRSLGLPDSQEPRSRGAR